MSLVTYPNSNKSKTSGHAAKKNGAQAAVIPTFGRRLQRMFAAAGRLLVNVCEAIAEARMQKAMIEAELYLNRYKHTSKNDDDLPVVR